MRFDRIIKGGNVVTPAGTFTGDVGIAGEKIAALGADLETDRAPRSSTPAGITSFPACSTSTSTSSCRSAARSPPTTIAPARAPARAAASRP